MTVLIAAADTTGEVTVEGGSPVSVVLVPTTADGLPRDAHASIAWKGAASINSPFLVLGLHTPGTSLVGAGDYVVTKSSGAFTVERS